MMEPFVIRQITAGKPDLIAASSGDSWDPTQGPDGRYYAASNDTAGFHGGDRNNVNFNVVEADGLSGATVNRMPEYGKQGEEKEDGRTWKTSGCYCVDGVLYLVAGRHCYGDESGDVRKRQTVINASILKSADFGKTWTRSESENYHDPMFPSDFCTPYFIHYGQDGAAPDVDNAQQYIYAVSNNGFWDSGDYYVLGRVLRDRLGDLNPRDWSFLYRGRRHAGGKLDIRCRKSRPHHRRAVPLRRGRAHLYPGYRAISDGGLVLHWKRARRHRRNLV